MARAHPAVIQSSKVGSRAARGSARYQSEVHRRERRGPRVDAPKRYQCNKRCRAQIGLNRAQHRVVNSTSLGKLQILIDSLVHSGTERSFSVPADTEC